MTGYTRQSSGVIIPGADILASNHNNEFNQIEASFNNSTGHAHSGGVGEGAPLTSASFTNNTTEGQTLAAKIGALLTVKIIADLRALPVVALQKAANVSGYYAEGDGGEGLFYWSSSSMLADDNGYVIKPTSVGGGSPGRWLRYTPTSDINPRHYGAKGDNIADDTVPFQAALDRHKAVGGRLYVPAGTFRITSTLQYSSAAAQHGPNIVGEGAGASVIYYDFATGLSLLKIRNTTPNAFLRNGGIHKIDFEGPLVAGARKYGFFTQQAAIDISGWINWSITECSIQNIAGHAIWTPYRFITGNNNTGVGLDFPNDKPWTYVTKANTDGRPGVLRSRVDPATGAITGFQINRWGTGYSDGAAIIVTGKGTGPGGRACVATIKTSYSFTGNTTAGSQTISGIATSDNKWLVFGQQIVGGSVPANSLVGLVTAGGTSITVTNPAVSTATGVTFTVTWEGGGIVSYDIADGGLGYYEADEHLFDNTDPYTTGLAQIHSNQIVANDGLAINWPHFSAPQTNITNNYMVTNASGGILLGCNHAIIENNGFGLNGMHPVAGWYPGLWVCRVVSNTQCVRVQNNEFESNPYTGVLCDGVNGIDISHNRFNSSVTAWKTGTNWDRQIPYAQIKFEIGNNSVSNTDFTIADNCHRWQGQFDSIPAANCDITSGGNTITNVAVSGLPALTFKVGARVELLDAGGAVIPLNPGAVTETTIFSINTGAQTMTLVHAPTITLVGAAVRVKINLEPILLYDLGRNSNSTVGQIRSPFLASVQTKMIKGANWRSQDSIGAQFDYTEGGFRKHGSPGLNAANVRLSAADVVTIPALNIPIVIPWKNNLDPENLLEFIPQIPPTPNLYTGRYSVVNSGIYDAIGAVTIPAATAGDQFTISGVLEFDQIATTGVVTTVSSIQKQTVASASGIAHETFPFAFSIPYVQFETFVGPYAPQQPPLSNATSGGEDGLIWWNPMTSKYKRWNGFISAWEDVVGTFTAPFLLNAWLSVTISTNRAATINLDTLTSGYNYLTFKRVG